MDENVDKFHGNIDEILDIGSGQYEIDQRLVVSQYIPDISINIFALLLPFCLINSIKV